MRITGNRLLDLSAASTAKNQTAVATASTAVTSGLRVAAPSDDPAAWLAAQRAKLRQALSQGTGAAVVASRERLGTTDNALASLGDVVSQIRTIAIQGASGSYNATDRAGLGTEVRALFQAALDSANARGSDGEYLFAGSASLAAPFDPAGLYLGDAAVRSAPGDGSVTAGVTIAGTALTAASGVDVLPLLDRVATALSGNDLTTLTAALPDLDTAIKQISAARTQTGGVMTMLDQTTAAHAVLDEDLQKTVSRLVEADTTTAISELAKATQALEVSRAVSTHLAQVLRPST